MWCAQLLLQGLPTDKLVKLKILQAASFAATVGAVANLLAQSLSSPTADSQSDDPGVINNVELPIE